MKKLTVLMLMLFLAVPTFSGISFVSAQDSGKTYYISSSSGNDDNDGLTESTALKSFSKINSMVLEAGDKVLLRRGDEWNQRLELTGKGTADNWIIISDYGDKSLSKPSIRMNGGDDDVCILLKDFMPDNQGNAYKTPYQYINISNLYLCDARIGIYLRSYACENEQDEENRSKHIRINDVDIHNMFAPSYGKFVDDAREYEALFDRSTWMDPTQISLVAGEISRLVNEEHSRPKCDLPIISDGKYIATGGGDFETIFPVAIFHGGKKSAVYSVSEGANSANIDKTYPALSYLDIENVNISETMTGVMSWFYRYNASTYSKPWKRTLEYVKMKNVTMTGSINGIMSFDCTTGGAIKVDNEDRIIPNEEGWGLIENVRVVGSSEKSNHAWPLGGTGVILNNSSGFLITQCEFSGINNNDYPDGCGFDFESSNDNVEVVNSYFHNNAGGAILIMDSDKGPHTNIFIRNNLMYNNLVDVYEGGPRAPTYDDIKYINLYNGLPNQYHGMGDNYKNKNIIIENNRFFLPRENSNGTQLSATDLVGPVNAENGGYTLKNNIAGFFQNNKAANYYAHENYFSGVMANSKISLNNIAINHLVYNTVYLKVNNKTQLSGKIKLTLIDGTVSSEKDFLTSNGKVALKGLFNEVLRSAIVAVEISINNEQTDARYELEFIVDTIREVSILDNKTVRVKLIGDSKSTFSDVISKDDFSVNFDDFGNNIISVKTFLFDTVDITFENNLTEKQKQILSFGDSINILPTAYSRVTKEIYEGRGPNAEINKKSFFYISKLSVTSKPSKLNYKIGEELDLIGMKISSLNGDNTSADISFSKLKVGRFNNEKEGLQLVELKYNDKTILMEVVIEENTKSVGCKSDLINPVAGLISITVLAIAFLINKKSKQE